MSLRYIAFALWLLVLSLAIVPPSVSAQAATARDTLSADSVGSLSGSDSLKPASDSIQPTSDSLRRAAAAQQDSAASAPDSARAPEVERDSIIVVACGRLTGGASVAPDLLVIVFTPEAGRAERAAVARSVTGKLLGAVSSEPGAYYLRVSTGGKEYKLRAVADELIRSPWVRQVGSRTCPSAESPSGTRRVDTLSPSGR